jgi:hypothetical protein
MAWRLNLDLHAASRLITFVSANLILRHSCLLQFVRRQALVAINAVNSGPLWYPIFYIMNSENRPIAMLQRQRCGNRSIAFRKSRGKWDSARSLL